MEEESVSVTVCWRGVVWTVEVAAGFPEEGGVVVGLSFSLSVVSDLTVDTGSLGSLVEVSSSFVEVVLSLACRRCSGPGRGTGVWRNIMVEGRTRRTAMMLGDEGVVMEEKRGRKKERKRR